MTEKTYMYAGTSRSPEGQKTFRVTNIEPNLRATTLRFHGHTDIELFTLPRKMTKVKAIAWLIEQGVKDGVVPTRAADKDAKTAVQLAAEELVAGNKAKAKAKGVKIERTKLERVNTDPRVTSRTRVPAHSEPVSTKRRAAAPAKASRKAAPAPAKVTRKAREQVAA